ncbi:ATPase component of tungstate ABC transporter [Lachnospiraceae bacterium TWA4]|nr:ATPase component of tungstate ABC transporter [Lachnospiraceae bacterium TWA4]
MSIEKFEWKNLKKSYERRVVLDIESLRLQPGKCYAIIGENGAGKSTCLKMLAGVLKSDSKEILKPEKYCISYMPQTPYIFSMSVLKNMSKLIKEKSTAQLEEVLERMDINNLKDKPAQSLSGGEKQRLAFCRVISKPCDLLLLDEPSSAMDIQGIKLFEKVLRDYHRECNCTVIMVMHDIAQVKRLADEIIFMKDGKIITQGSFDELALHSENMFVKQYLEHFLN